VDVLNGTHTSSSPIGRHDRPVKSPFVRVGYLGSKEVAAMWMTQRLALLVVAGIIVGANCAVAADGPAAQCLNGRRSQ
jgi:hypothetical protein